MASVFPPSAAGRLGVLMTGLEKVLRCFSSAASGPVWKSSMVWLAPAADWSARYSPVAESSEGFRFTSHRRISPSTPSSSLPLMPARYKCLSPPRTPKPKLGVSSDRVRNPNPSCLSMSSTTTASRRLRPDALKLPALAKREFEPPIAVYGSNQKGPFMIP